MFFFSYGDVLAESVVNGYRKCTSVFIVINKTYSDVLNVFMYTFFFSVIGFKLHVAMIYEMVKLQLVRRKQLSFRELNTTPLLKKGIAKIFSMTFPAITECLLNLW